MTWHTVHKIALLTSLKHFGTVSLGTSAVRPFDQHRGGLSISVLRVFLLLILGPTVKRMYRMIFCSA